MNAIVNGVVLADLGNPATKIVFHTLSGSLTVSRGPVEEGAPVEACPPLVMSLPLLEPKDPLPAACRSPESPLVKALCPGLQARLHNCLRLLGSVFNHPASTHVGIKCAHAGCTCQAKLIHTCSSGTARRF